jgi:hypothetical protein
VEPRWSGHFGSQENCPDKWSIWITELHLIDLRIFCSQKNCRDGEAYIFNEAQLYLSTSGFRGTGPLRMVMMYIPSDATWHKKQECIWFRGGISVVFEILRHFWLIFLIKTHAKLWPQQLRDHDFNNLTLH